MSDKTGIAWTDETINAVIGCEKVSPGCKHCYAEEQTPARVARAEGRETWGPRGERYETKGWVCALRRAHRKAIREGRRIRIFACSMSDPFMDDPTWDRVRPWYFAALEAATACDVQVLTKRPENILRMVPASWLRVWPAHVWIGTTAEDQERAEERIPHLLRVPARVRFLSVEPQIEAIDLTDLVQRNGGCDHHFDALRCDVDPEDDGDWNGATISWVIQGGESGPHARPFDLAWARSMRDQCKSAGVPHFLKQLGATPFDRQEMRGVAIVTSRLRLRDSHGCVSGNARHPRRSSGHSLSSPP